MVDWLGLPALHRRIRMGLAPRAWALGGMCKVPAWHYAEFGHTLNVSFAAEGDAQTDNSASGVECDPEIAPTSA